MTLEKVTSYIATIDKDHKITLPPETLIGAKVIVTLVPMTLLEPAPDSPERRARFAATLKAIEAADKNMPPVELGDEELQKLVDEVRGTTTT